MSSTALHILELVKSLPSEEQRLVCALLNRRLAGMSVIKRPTYLRTPDGGYLNPNGLPSDDPFFKIMDSIDAERSKTPARPLPELE